jgi:subtilisin
MHRRLAPLLLAVLVAFPIVVPATAAEPAPSPSLEVPPSPAAEPTPVPEPTPSADPTAAPSPSATPDPTVAPAPTADPTPAEPTVVPVASPAADGRPDATGRYIVMLRNGSNTAAVVERGRVRDGLKVDRSFGHAVRGFSAKLDKQQKRDLQADPSVLAIVPDGVIELAAQTVPTGVSRVGGRLSDVADIDGSDQRVDADVAIVDTGITAVPDLNVAGGYNCSTSDRTAWRDRNNHGTHVAGTVAALDNSFGVVGIAPGARVWGVKILNDSGYGLISWYVCGLDWILAQRDPNDASRPLFEAVNMSVTKDGADDHNCGQTSHDALHLAICRLVAGGITVVAAAANDSHSATHNIPASYDEVITVSALADTDGKPGGLGGNRCFSWGGYDKDDTFADFSNYGYDVDLIAPGKCILSTIPGPGYAYMSGTSMAAPTVTGAVALYKASRPKATPAEVREALRYLGNLNWKTSTDPDPTHEPLLDVSRIGQLGTFALTPGATAPTVEGNTTLSIPFTVARSSTFFERVQLSLTSVPAGWGAVVATPSLMGWAAIAARLTVTVPRGTPAGSYAIGVKGTNQGRTVLASLPITVVEDTPTASVPYAALQVGATMGHGAANVRVLWAAATDPSSPIAGYQLQRSQDGGPWGATIDLAANRREAVITLPFDKTYRFRMRAIDRAFNWSPWAETPTSTRVHAVDDRSTSIARAGSWVRVSNSSAYKSTVSGSTKAGSRLTLSFTGHGVAVVGSTGPYRGKANVYIDGVFVRTISMKSGTTRSRQVAFTSYFPAGGSHTISFVATGSGTYRLVRLDAFVVLK